jgi:16S rRNA (cytosine967-C5)-methyltransferase
MTPAARIASAIEVLEKVEASARPADEVVTSYFRGRRYIGAKDRRAISDRVFRIERRRAQLDWWTGTSAPRARVIAELALEEGLTPESAAQIFDGGKFAPAPLTAEEQKLLERLAGRSWDAPEMPTPVRLELPEWIAEKLAARWGERMAEEMAALNTPAPLDLRVNTLKATRAEAQARLAAEGIETQPTPISPLGLRVTGRAGVATSGAFRAGLVEVQDEGSQLAALLTGAKADRLTIDLCAGAGGKTLALAALMKDGGPLVACDTDAQRLQRMEARLTRAGISNVTRKRIHGLDDPWLASLDGRGERVLVDAPCSGSGAWRRNPGARWRLTPERLDALIAEQRRILASAARLTKPGGRLIYVTCSILPDENQQQADLFLESEPAFRALPVARVWSETVGDAPPTEGAYLTLTPASTNTDGFFVAVFEKAAA